ncbi:MAG TPA: SBBP repeat-containing protein [Verrucomicrobiota bacterium]|nr:SBBP repeat-containing protein [Verrucomicrobiota bacterium]
MTRSPWGVGTWGFTPNVGQAAPGVDFIAQAPGGAVRLAGPRSDIVLAGPKGQRQGVFSPGEDAHRVPHHSVYVVRMHLLDAATAPEATGENPLPGYANFFLGAHPGHSQVGVPTYEKVRYREVYPGIDLIYYGNPHELEFDFALAPGADPGLIRLRFDGTDALRLEEGGTLAMPTPVGTVRLKPPRVYQESGGRRQELKGDYALLGPDCVGFAVPDRDVGQALVIDPVLEFSTFFSASGIDRAHRLEVAPDGSIFVLGQTWSSDFPITADGWQTNRTTASCMHFLARFDAQGERLLYSTYVGYAEYGWWAGLALTPDGEPVMAGYVTDADYPVTPGSLGVGTTNEYGGIGVLKLDTRGQLAFAALIDGPINERGQDVAVDAAGNIYVLAALPGNTTLPMVNAYQNATKGREEVALFKLNPQGSAILYSSFLGGSQRDYASTLAVDDGGNAYLIGTTDSTDFPAKNSPIPASAAVPGSYLAKFNTLAAGEASLVFSRFHFPRGTGSSGYSHLDLDRSGNLYLCGGTTSASDFPLTANAFQTTYGGYDTAFSMIVGEAFVQKLSPAGQTLYSTYLGGSGGDEARALRVSKADGKVYVIGTTISTSFPTAAPVQSGFSGPCGVLGWGCSPDLFIAELDPSILGPGGLLFSTYLGEVGIDTGVGIAVTPSGDIVGLASAGDTFPTTPGSYQPAATGTFDQIVLFKIGPGASLALEKRPVSSEAFREHECAYSIVISNNGPGTAADVIARDTLPAGLAFVSAAASQGQCSVVNGIVTCELGAIPNGGTATIEVTVIPAREGAMTNTVVVSSPSDPAIAAQPASTVISVQPAPDADGDGLPNWWEEKFFGSTSGADPSQNSDGDRLTDGEEYIVGSDPTVPDDFTIVLSTLADSPALAVLSSPLRVYRLEKSKDPRSGLWETVQSGVYGNGGLLILEDTNRTGFDLYRVGVSLPAPFD